MLTVLRLNSASGVGVYSGAELAAMEAEEAQLVRGLKDLYEHLCMQAGERAQDAPLHAMRMPPSINLLLTHLSLLVCCCC